MILAPCTRYGAGCLFALCKAAEKEKKNIINEWGMTFKCALGAEVYETPQQFMWLNKPLANTMTDELTHESWSSCIAFSEQEKVSVNRATACLHGLSCYHMIQTWTPEQLRDTIILTFPNSLWIIVYEPNLYIVTLVCVSCHHNDIKLLGLHTAATTYTLGNISIFLNV